MEYFGLDIGVNSQQGRRPYQEDEFSVSVLLLLGMCLVLFQLYLLFVDSSVLKSKSWK